jgi:hypothetical protein
LVVVTYVRLGNHLAPMCLQRLQDSFEEVAYSEFASYLLDVDGFALVAKLALSSDKVCRSTIEMFRSYWLFYAIAKSSEATAGPARQ